MLTACGGARRRNFPEKTSSAETGGAGLRHGGKLADSARLPKSSLPYLPKRPFDNRE